MRKYSVCIVENIIKNCLAYDLMLINAKSELEMINAKVKRFSNSTTLKNKQNYIYWCSEQSKQKDFIEELTKIKSDLLKNLNLIFAKYNKRYKDVFESYYIKGKSVEEVAEEIGYSEEAVENILAELERDLKDFYC